MPNMHTGALMPALDNKKKKKNTWRYYSLDGLIVDCDPIRLAPHYCPELISWRVNKVFDLFAIDRFTPPHTRPFIDQD